MSSSHLLDSVMGFMALNMFEDALIELENLPEEAFSTESVAVLKFDVHIALKHWTTAREMAQNMTLRLPESPHWWCRWAWALRFETSVGASRAVLTEGVLLHPCNAGIHYNLACYACLMGDLKEAKARLDNALKLDPGYTQAAYQDPDLNGLRKI